MSKIEEALIDRKVVKSKLSAIKQPSLISKKHEMESIEEDKTRMFSPQTL